MTKSAEIIAVGTELLLGEIVNTDGAYIASRLAEIGINVFYQTTVGDNPSRLSDVLRIAAGRADIIITTGGLGPTYDDLTKETIVSFFGKKLVRDEASLEYIREFFKSRGKTMTENNLKQADMPEDCTIFKNYWGTAPACAFTSGDNTVVMLPGPPSECNPIVDTHVIPYLMKYSDGVLSSRYIRVTGIGESEVEHILRDIMVSSTNPTVAPYAKENSVLLRITARAATRDEGLLLCDPVCAKIKELIGPAASDENSGNAEEIAFLLLRKKGLTLSAAESCTGGLFSKKLTDLSGASVVFPGSVCTYSNASKSKILGIPEQIIEENGAVSEQVASEMAKSVRVVFSSDIGVGITGIAGPSGGSKDKPLGLVYIAVSDGKKTVVTRNLFGGAFKTRDRIRNEAVVKAFNMVCSLIDG